MQTIAKILTTYSLSDLKAAVKTADEIRKTAKEKKNAVWAVVLLVLAGILIVAAAAYAIYKYLTPDYLDDFDDDLDDDFEDDFFEDEEDDDKSSEDAEETPAAKAEEEEKKDGPSEDMFED